MVTERVIRVVLASPSDVQAERVAAASVIDSLNKMLPDSGFPGSLRLVRWETDAYPGLHDHGPQGLIDERLRIEGCDILIGVFWKRFGTPVGDAESGTAHEIRRAIEGWKARGTPQVKRNSFENFRTSSNRFVLHTRRSSGDTGMTLTSTSSFIIIFGRSSWSDCGPASHLGHFRSSESRHRPTPFVPATKALRN
jgi:hypothetical protein